MWPYAIKLIRSSWATVRECDSLGRKLDLEPISWFPLTPSELEWTHAPDFTKRNVPRTVSRVDTGQIA